MRSRFLFMGLVLALGAGERVCATEQSLLPEQFGAWHKQSGEVKRAQSLLSAEAGELEYTCNPYHSGPDTITICLGKYRDPSSAYEIYTSFLSPNMEPSTVGGPSAIDTEEFVALIGNFVLEVRSPAKPSKAELEQLVMMVSKGADRTPLPPIRAYLPRGFTDGTQRYAHGQAGFEAALGALHRSDYQRLSKEIGWTGDEAEAMLAEYRGGKDSGVVLLIDYPTQQLAMQHLKHLESILPDVDKQEKTKIERRGSLLSMVLGPTSASYADGLRAAVRYQTEVTWHEPTHTITDPPWTTILGKIITLTMLFMVVTVVLGVAFGGFRVVMKKMFPGKVFDRPNEMDVLQLGLSGKRIDSEDFY